MAKIEFKGIEKYAKKLNEIGARSEGICKYAVYEGAAVVADAIKANIPVDSGDLRDSMTLTAMRNQNGFIYTEITFPGYDEKGVPNAVKANVLESGSSTRQKHPFIRPAVNRSKAAAEAAMEIALYRKLGELIDE